MDTLSTLFVKLLQSLTRERHLSKDNWQDALRRQWNWRAEDTTPQVLGRDEEPVDWASLSIEKQLDTLHGLCEWQLEWPDRLRRLANTDEEAVSWRVDPAGWDHEGNTYWLFDDNRLWVQRVPPRPKKRKAPPPKKRAKKRAPPPRSSGRRSARLSRETEAAVAESLKPEDVFNSESELSNPPSEEETSAFVEFEAVCVTLEDWQRFLERFANAKHPDERSLYSYLAKEVYPRVEEVVLAERRKQALEEAMSHRKRSSRIAMKESEREERERELNEARAAREKEMVALAAERERARREQMETSARRSREERLRDREERILARERRLLERSRSRTPHVEKEPTSVSEPASAPASEPAPERRSDADWLLRCEVCGTEAKNPPGEPSVVACERCGVWQHTECWDRREVEQGQAPRNWEQTDFYCTSCQQNSPKLRPEQVYEGHSQAGSAPSHPAVNAVGQDRLLTLMAAYQPVATSAPLSASLPAGFSNAPFDPHSMLAPSMTPSPARHDFAHLTQLHGLPTMPPGALPSGPPALPTMTPIALLRKGLSQSYSHSQGGNEGGPGQSQHAPFLSQYHQEPSGLRRPNSSNEQDTSSTRPSAEPRSAPAPEPPAHASTSNAKAAPSASTTKPPENTKEPSNPTPNSGNVPDTTLQRTPPAKPHAHSPQAHSPQVSRTMSPPGAFPLRRTTVPSPLSRRANPTTEIPQMQLDASSPSAVPPPLAPSESPMPPPSTAS